MHPAAWLVAVVLVVPSIVVAVTWFGADWYPTQDFAVLDLRMRALLTGDTPLTGAFSRYGWNHPGPFWYWILAPLYLVTGGQPWSLVVGAAAYSAVVLGLGCHLAARLGGWRAVVGFGAVAALTYASLGGWVTFTPWNPHLAITTFLTFLVVALAWSLGDQRLTPVVAVGASALVQLHVAYLSLVVPVLIWGTVSFVRAGGLGRLRSEMVLVLGSVASLAVLWAPAVIDAVLRPPGNLYNLVAYSVKGSEAAGEAVGLGYAAGIAGYGFRIPPPFLVHVETSDWRGWVVPGSPAWLLVGFGLCAAAWVLARRGDVAVRKLVQLATVSQVAVVLAASRLAGERWSYLVDWRFVVAALVWVAFFVALAGRLGRAHLTRALTVVGVGALVVVSSWRTSVVVGSDAQVLDHEGVTRVFVDDVARTATSPAPPVIVPFDAALAGLRDGVLNGARREGLDVRALDADRAKYGDGAVIDLDAAGALWRVSETSYGTSLLLDEPGTRVLALYSPLSQADEELIGRLHVEAAAALQRADRLDLLPSLGSTLVEFALADVDVPESVDLAALAALNDRVNEAAVCRCAVVATGRTDAPRTANEAAAALPSRYAEPASAVDPG
jgi:hypothetical protein